jgi:hypothetical protein
MTNTKDNAVTRIFVTKIEDDDSSQKYMVLRENAQGIETSCVKSKDEEGKEFNAKFNTNGCMYNPRELYNFLKDGKMRYEVHYCPRSLESEVRTVIWEYGRRMKEQKEKNQAREEERKRHEAAVKQGFLRLKADTLVHDMRQSHEDE